jgi:hypothetical protein
MTSTRRTTIHDLTALRVHPDGTFARPPNSKPLNRQGGYHTIKDRRGNWIADDASGPSNVKLRKRKGGEGEDEGRGEDGGEDLRKKLRRRRSEAKGPRAVKRQKFFHNLAFLDPPTQGTPQGGSGGEFLPVPGSVRTSFLCNESDGTYGE